MPKFDPETGQPLSGTLPDDPEELQRLIDGANAKKSRLAAAANPDGKDPAGNADKILSAAGIPPDAQAQLAGTPMAGVVALMKRQVYAADNANTPEQKAIHDEWIALLAVVLGLVQHASGDMHRRIEAAKDGANVT